VAEPEITPEQLAEEVRRLKVEDILVATVTTLGQLAYAKLGAREFDQARLAIDSIAALLGPLDGVVEPQLLRDFNGLLANVRLAFADAVAKAPAPAEEAAPEPGAEG
jgi:hypothetical protein